MPPVLYDTFISHAGEDKAIARVLTYGLMQIGYTVWLDQAVLLPGDSIRGKIDEGLSNCMTGIVILSPNFFKKAWARMELDGLATRQGSGEDIILPIWHNIGVEEVLKHAG